MANHDDRNGLSGSEYSPSSNDSDSDSQASSVKKSDVIAGVDISHATNDELKELLRKVEGMRLEAEVERNRLRNFYTKVVRDAKMTAQALHSEVKRLIKEKRKAREDLESKMRQIELKHELAELKNESLEVKHQGLQANVERLEKEADELFNQRGEARFNRDHAFEVLIRLFGRVARVANQDLNHWDDPFELTWEDIDRFVRSRFNIEMEQIGHRD
ncbi:37S ribosomal protein S24, mitochondrial [Hypoxylon texense]